MVIHQVVFVVLSNPSKEAWVSTVFAISLPKLPQYFTDIPVTKCCIWSLLRGASDATQILWVDIQMYSTWHFIRHIVGKKPQLRIRSLAIFYHTKCNVCLKPFYFLYIYIKLPSEKCFFSHSCDPVGQSCHLSIDIFHHIPGTEACTDIHDSQVMKGTSLQMHTIRSCSECSASSYDEIFLSWSRFSHLQWNMEVCDAFIYWIQLVLISKKRAEQVDHNAGDGKWPGGWRGAEQETSDCPAHSEYILTFNCTDDQ